MFKTLKSMAIVSAALLLAAGAAEATPVPAGTLTLAPFHYNPTVSTANGTVILGVTATPTKGVTYSGGTGQFANLEDPPFGSFTLSTINFATTAGLVTNYSGGNAINNFLTFYDSPDGTTINETYTFNLDQSITTVSNAVTGQGQTIALYILGDMVGTGADGTFTTLTPTALTLTLNNTGTSSWTYSATLSNPPPGLAGSPVPEPASMALLGAGLAGLGLVRRRKRQ